MLFKAQNQNLVHRMLRTLMKQYSLLHCILELEGYV